MQFELIPASLEQNTEILLLYISIPPVLKFIYCHQLHPYTCVLRQIYNHCFMYLYFESYREKKRHCKPKYKYAILYLPIQLPLSLFLSSSYDFNLLFTSFHFSQNNSLQHLSQSIELPQLSFIWKCLNFAFRFEEYFSR